MPWPTIALTVIAVLLAVAAPMEPSEAAGDDRERGFFDLYGGAVHMFESDVPDWKLQDQSATVGGRAGVWLGRNVGLTFRAWYFQTDAKLDQASPSDLALLGLSLELMGRWRLSDAWAMYGTLGPMVAVTSLDRQRDRLSGVEDDSRSVAPGGSLSIGTELRVFERLRAFVEVQTSLVYPEFHLAGRTSSPRLLTIYGLTGLRLGF